jgi:hypothetical protein
MQNLKNQLIEKYPFAKSGVIQQLNYNDAINAILLIQRDPDKLAELNHSLQSLVVLMYTNQPLFNYTEYARYPNIQKSLAIINSTMKRGGANNDIELTSLLIGIIVAIVIMVGIGIGMTWMYNSRKVAPSANDYVYDSLVADHHQPYDYDDDDDDDDTIKVEDINSNLGSFIKNAFVNYISINKYTTQYTKIINDNLMTLQSMITNYMKELEYDRGANINSRQSGNNQIRSIVMAYVHDLVNIHAHNAAIITYNIMNSMKNMGFLNNISEENVKKDTSHAFNFAIHELSLLELNRNKEYHNQLIVLANITEQGLEHMKSFIKDKNRHLYL